VTELFPWSNLKLSYRRLLLVGGFLLVFSMQAFSFTIHHHDAHSAARRSTFTTPHGSVEMPAFMPVGTQATVKGMTLDMLRGTGAHMILGNTYHLALRPGSELIAELGGLHRFSGWTGPILTDSGGFQLFSLAQMTKVTEQEATFRSHIDGKLFHLSPERAVEIQEQLGSDVAMVLDHVVALPSTELKIREACSRSIRWAERCKKVSTRADQAQFAIIQGGLLPELRKECALALAQLDFPGYAVGGLSVGEAAEDMYRTLDAVCPVMPSEKPRYLMGVGKPEDLLEGIRRGIDMFDCVMPTRNGRNASAFSHHGQLRFKNLKYQRDQRPIEPDCPCPACKHSRAYIRHLFMAKEMLGPMLLTVHNLTYYQRLMAEAREAIAADCFVEYHEERKRKWQESA
jgi:queuine tRNA-ribosyltransferase